MKEHVLLWKAIHALGVDLPVLSYEILAAGSIRLYLYGGQVVEYTLPPVEPEAPPARLPERTRPGRRG